MAQPTTKQFWQAAGQAYNDPKSKDPKKVLVPPDGCHLADYRRDDDEFVAATFTHASEPWSIVAFKGTSPNISFTTEKKVAYITLSWPLAFSVTIPVQYNQTQIHIDETLFQDAKLAMPMGGVPTFFTKGVAYFENAQRRAGGRTLYLGGHSLGGAIAEYVASQPANRAAGGTCFASPGSTVFPKVDSALRSIVDYNDLIGRFCSAHHVGQIHMLDIGGMALTADIPYAALQNAITNILNVEQIWGVGGLAGRGENYVDIVPLLNVLGLIAMFLSILRYHMIDHYGMILGFTGSAWHTRAIAMAIANAIRALAAAAYHAGLRAAHAVASAAESTWEWLRREVSFGLYELMIGLKAICAAIGELRVKIEDGILWLCWETVAVPIIL